MSSTILYAITAILVVIASILYSAVRMATKESVYLSSFIALMCIEEDVYKNHASDFKSWIVNNIDTASIDARGAYAVNKVASSMATNFLNKLGGASAPLVACLSQLRKSN